MSSSTQKNIKIASWNVNSIRVRLNLVLDWLNHHRPDFLCLQELKCSDEDFPEKAFIEAGFQCHYRGQKAYNGVAIISKNEAQLIRTHLPLMKDDPQARYIEIAQGDLRLICLYAPNGNPIESDKFPYKLDWHNALCTHIQDLLTLEERLVIAGDYNIIPGAEDVWDETRWLGDALYQPQSRQALRRMMWLGLTDAIKASHKGGGHYTFWDYQGGAFQNNHGIRIDHILLSPKASDLLSRAGIDKNARALEKPSDHVPIWIEMDEAQYR